MLYAHTPNDEGVWHLLGDHLDAVAQLASQHAEPFGGEMLARWAGQLHDTGKASDDFQAYLASCAREPGRRFPTVDHKGAGTLLAWDLCEPLAFIVAGHHNGLPDAAQLVNYVKRVRSAPITQDAIANARACGIVLPEDGPATLSLPPTVEQNELAAEFFIRMLFSAIVDADYLDTERHFHPHLFRQRVRRYSFDDLTASLEERLSGLNVQTSTDILGLDQDVIRVRREVSSACQAASYRPPGFFRLTVPTGGGKTLSSLRFALHHVMSHLENPPNRKKGFRRVIIAVPYLAITDQTASTLRDIFGDDGPVLEHHSGIEPQTDERGYPTSQERWRQLSAQNWEAPIVVTTTVQLFNSLLANGTASCRKLHNIAGSVLILDEPQTLPISHWQPIFQVLEQLVSDYHVSVVLSTATQLGFESLPGLPKLKAAYEIVSDSPRLYTQLRRVNYEWPRGEEKWSWSKVAFEVRRHDRVLTIVNTKKDAVTLGKEFAGQETIHLSTLLCAAHRRDLLHVIRRRLRLKQQCRVVSTQVLEAGVDLDFPHVFRALGPLERIAQAAGRCNRHGEGDSLGSVVVFDPEDGHFPLDSAYEQATAQTQALLRQGRADLDDPSTFPRYFAELSSGMPTDEREIQPARRSLRYDEVARNFRLIEDSGIPILVPYVGLDGDLAEELKEELRERDLPEVDHGMRLERLLDELDRGLKGRSTMRPRRAAAQLQPYLVTYQEHQMRQISEDPRCIQVTDGLHRWTGNYGALGIDVGGSLVEFFVVSS